MPTIAIENGKRIEELIDINRLNDDSYFVVSDAALTRKITLLNLRNAFNGDSATSNLGNVYYSVEKINELLDHVYDEITKINGRLDNMEDRINKIYNDFGANLSEFKKYVEKVFAELRLADQNLNTKIDNTKSELNTTIDNTKSELNTKIDNVNKALDARLKVVEAKLANIEGIQIGTEVPMTLKHNVIYLQYF